MMNAKFVHEPRVDKGRRAVCGQNIGRRTRVAPKWGEVTCRRCLDRMVDEYPCGCRPGGPHPRPRQCAIHKGKGPERA